MKIKLFYWVRLNVELIGWIAFTSGFFTFLSQIDQIRLNISGHPGSVYLGITLTASAILWTLYGIGKNSKQIIFANIIGIFIGIAMTLTSLDKSG